MITLSKFLNFPGELSENDELREFELSGSDRNMMVAMIMTGIVTLIIGQTIHASNI